MKEFLVGAPRPCRRPRSNLAHRRYPATSSWSLPLPRCLVHLMMPFPCQIPQGIKAYVVGRSSPSLQRLQPRIHPAAGSNRCCWPSPWTPLVALKPIHPSVITRDCQNVTGVCHLDAPRRKSSPET
jgi:hypothetical protein